MGYDLVKELAAALREAIEELNICCEEIDGEGYNCPRWNDLLQKADDYIVRVDECVYT